MLPIRRVRLFGGSRHHRTSTRTNSSSTQPVTVRARRIDPHSVAQINTSSLPEALPSDSVTDLYPELKCPLANVIVTDPCALEPWLLVARPVSKEYAESVGGCIVFTPSTAASTNGSHVFTAESQYYCVTWSDDEVYGRACYLPSPSTSHASSQSCTDTASECDSCDSLCCTDGLTATEGLLRQKEELLGCCSVIPHSSDMQLKPCACCSSE